MSDSTSQLSKVNSDSESEKADQEEIASYIKNEEKKDNTSSDTDTDTENTKSKKTEKKKVKKATKTSNSKKEKKAREVESDSEDDSDTEGTKSKKAKKTTKKKKAKEVELDSGHDSDAEDTKPKKAKKKIVKKKKGKKIESDSEDDLPEEIKDQSDIIMALSNRLHNMMRNRDHVVGAQAHHDIIRMLFLVFIQPHLDGRLSTLKDVNVYKKLPHYNEDYIDALNMRVLMVIKLSNNNFRDTLKCVWKVILGNHPMTKDIFDSQDFFVCKDKTIFSCLKEIEKMLKDVNFNDLSVDIKGIIYETFVNKYASSGKELGQFFTPRKLIGLIFNLNNILFENKLREMRDINLYDPCMGTAGFLTEMVRHFKQNNIVVLPGNIHGNEIHAETYASGLMNLLLSTGDICNTKCRDSLLFNSDKKYTWICTNPPFGMKGIKYKELMNQGELDEDNDDNNAMSMSDMYQVQTNDGSALFLQHCMYKLKKDGICNIVLPDGQIMSGNNFKKLREHLVTKFNVKAILHAPSGTFDNAGVKTCILFFTTGKTDKVAFYETTKECKEAKFVCEASRKKIKKNNYVLGVNYYKPIEATFYKPNTIIKKLGDICTLQKGKHKTTDIKEVIGDSKFISISKEEKWFNVDFEDDNGEAMFISNVSSGKVWPIQYYNGKFAYCNLLFRICTNEEILLKYLYYFLINTVQKDIMTSYVKGTANLSLDQVLFNNINIPIYPIEEQKKIIKQCDLITQTTKDIEKLITSHKEVCQLYLSDAINTLFKSGQIKKLNTLCDIECGQFIVKNDLNDGQYSVIGSARPIRFHSEYNTEANTIIINKRGSAECISMYDTPIFATDDVYKLVNINNSVENMYLYYYLKSIQCTLYELPTEATKLNLSRDVLELLEIPTPSLEKQKEIIQQYEAKKIEFCKIRRITVDLQNSLSMLTW